jgi:hypothetical protein
VDAPHLDHPQTHLQAHLVLICVHLNVSGIGEVKSGIMRCEHHGLTVLSSGHISIINKVAYGTQDGTRKPVETQDRSILRVIRSLRFLIYLILSSFLTAF